MASWGHVVFKATRDTALAAVCRMHHRHYGFCGKPLSHIKRFTYTTGSDGTLSGPRHAIICDTWVCESHAQAFAAKYKIAILEADPGGGPAADTPPDQFNRTTDRPAGQIPHVPELNRPGNIGCLCLVCVTARARKEPAPCKRGCQENHTHGEYPDKATPPAEDLSADMKRRGYK